MKNNMNANINATANKAAQVAKKGLNILVKLLGLKGLGIRISRAFRGNSSKEIYSSILAALDDEIDALRESGNQEVLQERLADREGLAKLFAVGEFAAASMFGIVRDGIKSIDSELERAFDESDNAIIGVMRLAYEGIKTGAKTVGAIIVWIAQQAVKLAARIIAFFVNAVKKIVAKVKAKKLGDSLVGDFEDNDDFDNDEDEPESYYDDQGNLHVIYEDGEVIFTPEQIAEGVGMVNP